MTIGYINGIGFTGTTITAGANISTSRVGLFGITNLGVASGVTVSQSATTGEVQYRFEFWIN